MVTDKNNSSDELDTNDVPDELADEVAAAMEEFKAAQAKLDAAKAKMSSQNPACSADASTNGPSKPSAEKTPSAETVNTDSSIELEAEPATGQSAPSPASNVEPDWTPYTPSASNEAQVSPAAEAGYVAYGAVPAPSQGTPSQGTPTPPPDPYAQQPYYTPQNTAPPQTPQPQQQYHYQQQYSQPVVATKDHVAAGLLGIFLGWLGIHKFYLGYNTAGFIMLAVSIIGGVLTLGIAWMVVGLIGFIEGIIYLVKSQSEFEQIYVFNKREWF